ncbi:MAG: hypothetical protein HY706_01900, partial [Candidatus Hydrogenedentes bacterium]|nr:hypothetical protein [Candidatus Hydrogenedentota bacterium]
MYNCGPNTTVRNNILWENKSGGSTANAQIGGTSYTAPIYSCIQDWGSGGTGNIWSNPNFVSTDPTAPWENFLHLKNKKDTPPEESACVDAGSPGLQPKYRDFDHQSGPFDGNDDDEARRDIGADEAPTGSPGDFTYWWENFGSAPGP